MVFRVYYRCAYYSQEAHNNVRPRTRDEWDAYKFCKAVKHATVNGFFYTRDPKSKVNETNAILARKLFGKFVIETMQQNWQDAQRIVPVPSKDSWDTSPFRTQSMCRSFINDGAAQWVSPMVRYTQQRARASEGGDRGYDANYPYLAAIAEAGIQRAVLVDDIATSGGTLLATRRRLIEAGIDVLGVVVAGRTTATQLDPWQSGFIEVDDLATHLP